jgi:hypothetical protein
MTVQKIVQANGVEVLRKIIVEYVMEITVVV